MIRFSAFLPIIPPPPPPVECIFVNEGPSSIKCHFKDLLEQAAFWHEVEVLCCLTTPIYTINELE